MTLVHHFAELELAERGDMGRGIGRSAVQPKHRHRSARGVALLLSLAAAAGCVGVGEPPRGAGTLSLTIETTGEDVDADGYSVVIDGVIASYALPNAVARLEVAAGAHVIRIGGVASNCAGQVQRTITVRAAGETSEAFLVTCAAIYHAPIPPESLTVRISIAVVSTGEDIDSSGYTVLLEREPPGTKFRTGWALGPTDSTTLSVPTGRFSARLLSVAQNCTVLAPAAVGLVAASAAVAVRFAVHCLAIPPGQAIEVTTVTGGVDPDPDGYTVHVHNDLDMNGESVHRWAPVAANGSVVLSSVPFGYFLVTLDGVASNCTITPPDAKSAFVGVSEGTSVEFSIACVAR